jgi:AcrR family transcriptional regulator
MAPRERSPRERMVYSAAQLVRSNGVTGTGVRDVVAHSGAPRGSFQHYFPGGKDQLVGEAVIWSGDFAARWVTRYRKQARVPSPSGLFAHMARFWTDEFSTNGYAAGCPLMASAADLAAGDSAVVAQLRVAANRWKRAVVAELTAMGVPRRRAIRLATLMLSSLEGAIMLARVRRNTAPLNTVVAELGPLLDAQAVEAQPRPVRSD